MRRRGGYIVDTCVNYDKAAEQQDDQRADQDGGDRAHARRSEPDPDAEGEAEIARALARPLCIAGGLAELAFVDDPDIGREISAGLVAQPEAGIDVGKPGADKPGGIGLAVEVELDLRLEYQPLRKQKVVGSLQLGGEMPFTARIACELEIEEIGCQPLDAQRRPIAGPA